MNLDLSNGLENADLALSYDSRRLELLSADAIQRGTLTADFDVFAVNSDPETGTIRAGLGRSAGPITGQGSGSVLLIQFRIRGDAPAGGTIPNLRQSLGGTVTQLNEGGLDLVPDPSDTAGDPLDGRIVVLGAQKPTTIRSVEMGDDASRRSRVTSPTVPFGTGSPAGLPATAFHLRVETLPDAAGSLVGRQYRLTNDGGRVVNGSGRAVDDDRDGVAGAEAVETFFRSYDDRHADGDVLDRVAFRGPGLSQHGTSGSFSLLDPDAEEVISRKEAASLVRRLGTLLAKRSSESPVFARW